MHGQNVVKSRTVNMCSHLRRVLPKRPTGLFLLVNVGSMSRSLATSDIIALVALLVSEVRERSPSAGLCLRDLLPVGRSMYGCGAVVNGASVMPRVGQGLRALTASQGVPFVGLFPLFTRGKAGVLQGRLAASKLRLARRKCRV